MLFALAVASAAAAHDPSSAAEYVVRFNGALTAINSVSDGLVTLGSPGGAVKVGDPISVSYRFSADGVAPEFLFDADPTINIYTDVAVRDVRVDAGEAYRMRATSAFSTLQLWDNHFLSAAIPEVDTFSASLLAWAVPGASLPFDMGSGEVSQHVQLHAFDYGGDARRAWCQRLGKLTVHSTSGSAWPPSCLSWSACWSAHRAHSERHDPPALTMARPDAVP